MKRKYIISAAVVYLISFYLFCFSSFGFSIKNLAGSGNVLEGKKLVIPFSAETIYEGIHHTGLPGLYFLYSTDNFYVFLQNVDINIYKKILVADLFYPAVYSIFYFTILSFLLARVAPRLKILSLIPFAAAACDYIENYNIHVALNEFPGMTVSYMHGITFIKLSFMLLSMTLIILSLLLYVVRKNRVPAA